MGDKPTETMGRPDQRKRWVPLDPADRRSPIAKQDDPPGLSGDTHWRSWRCNDSGNLVDSLRRINLQPPTCQLET